MCAIMRRNSFDETKLGKSAPQLAEFQLLHARQEGYAGSIVIDLGHGQNLTINLWNNEEDATGALSILEAEVRRRLLPLMTAPSQLLGIGPVLAADVADQTRRSAS